MTRLKAVVLFVVLGALAPGSHAQSIELMVGRADHAGTVRMLLVHGEASLPVEVQIQPMSAADKAAALAQGISQDPSGEWRALAQDRKLTFTHFVAGEWLSVDAVRDFSDDTGSSNQLAKDGGPATFYLTLSGESAASGVNSLGQPSFFAVTLTDTLAWTHPLQQGETAEQALDELVAFLQEEAGEGVGVIRQSPTTVRLELDYEASAFNWQVTDTLLRPSAAAGEEPDAGFIER